MSTKKRITLIALCFALTLVTVVCWIVTYYGLFSMNVRQTMFYISFFNIDTKVFTGAPVRELDEVFNYWFCQAANNTFVDTYGWTAYGELNEQITKSLALFHAGFAVLTALFLAGGIASTVLLIKKCRLHGHKGAQSMSTKKGLILTAAFFALVTATVVCWIVTYYGLFSMNLHQSLSYIGFYNIEINPAWCADIIPEYLSQALRGEPVLPTISSFNSSVFERQVHASLVSFHIGFAVLTALFLAGGIASTVLLVKKRRKDNSIAVQ